MIARFHIVTPHRLLVAPQDMPQPAEFDYQGCRFRVHPPFAAQLDPKDLDLASEVPFDQLPPATGPADPQPISATERLNDREVAVCNTLSIDVLRDEFDRTPGSDDPPTELVFEIANSLLARVRILSRAHQIKPVRPESSIWRMTFLNDDETEVPEEGGLYRRRNGAQLSWQALSISPSLWDAAFTELPTDYRSPPWAALLLDASNLLPEVGPAMVLASAAIETRIGSALDMLASRSSLNPEFWTWLTERGGVYYKEPSIAEQLDQLLRGVAGVSLKDDQRLWEGYQNLRKARNSFAHEGRPVIGAEEVTPDRALQLLVLANEIVEWIEALLDPQERLPPNREWAKLSWERLIRSP